MPQRLGLTALLVDGYDTAIDFSSESLASNYATTHRCQMEGSGRWSRRMARPADCYWRGLSVTGNVEYRRSEWWSGVLFLETNDFARDRLAYTQRGIRFVEQPRHEPYGIAAVFEDLYGNRWDLIEPVIVTQ